jgi:integrase
MSLTDTNVDALEKREEKYDVWDDGKQSVRGLCVRVERSGLKTFYFVYSFEGRSRWLKIGPKKIGAKEARIRAKKELGKVADRRDPQAERMARRGGSTFDELADRHRDEHAKVVNKSWRQADKLVRKHLRPYWGKLPVAGISRSDVRAMMARLTPTAPIVANSTLAAASAIFKWCIKHEVGGLTVNPCYGVEPNETSDRDRVLSDAELPVFWREFDEAGVEGAALKLILLTGQRPGEVSRMHASHLVDGWWWLPGEVNEQLRWCGTKNSQLHRVWLSEPARAIIAAQEADGLVLTGNQGGLLDLDEAMREICARLRKRGVNVERTTPHDLRRTCGTTIVRLTKSEETMDRILNHLENKMDRSGRKKKKKKKVRKVYNLYKFEDEDRRAIESVASLFTQLIDGGIESNVIAAEFKKAL